MLVQLAATMYIVMNLHTWSFAGSVIVNSCVIQHCCSVLVGSPCMEHKHWGAGKLKRDQPTYVRTWGRVYIRRGLLVGDYGNNYMYKYSFRFGKPVSNTAKAMESV